MGNIGAELAIVGGGPAGMAAAIESAKSGVTVTLLDEGQKLGGQIYRQFPYGFHADETQLDRNYLDKDYLEGQKLIEEAKEYGDKIKILENSLVWGIFSNKKIAFIHNDKNETLQCQKLILAEGAIERPIPFPGWTLPGVFAAGGAQNILKTQRVLPGRRFLLAGTGPLQLVLANQLIKAGAEVVAVLEASSATGLKHLSAFWKHLSFITEGLAYLHALRKAEVPFLRAHAIIEARGGDEVNEATYAKVDRNWEPILGTKKTVKVDSVCIGYGFISSTRLSHLCGCEHKYDQMLGCWIPKYDENMETSVEGVFVAGDCAGVAGHLVAMEEGRIAGISASQQLGKISKEVADFRSLPIVRNLKGLRRVESALNEMSTIRPGIYSRITDDTIVCRCEEVTAGEIRKIIPSDSNIDLNEIKRATRAGMGDCQGRMCMSTIAAIVSNEKRVPIEKLAYITYRPPIKPIPLGALLEQ